MSTELLETWSDAFRFSEDLNALEDAFQQEQRAAVEQQVQSGKPAGQPDAVSPSGTSDDVFLEKLSEKIALRLGDHLQQPELLAQFLAQKGLEHDNVAMAHQIQDLNHQIAQQQTEIETLKRYQRQNKYHKIFGNVYLKTS